jgi:hypothetical protein
VPYAQFDKGLSAMRLTKYFTICLFVLGIFLNGLDAFADEWYMMNDLSFSTRAAHDYVSAQQQLSMPTMVWPRPIQMDISFKRSSAQISWNMRSGDAFLLGFETRVPEGPSLQVLHEGSAHPYRVQLQLGYDTNEEANWIADGSFVDFAVANWQIGAGAVPRWWGPGWDSSLILSSNARPAPGLYLERRRFTPFATPWLSWLGPWHAVTFMSQLESDRDFAHALLWGARVTFKPIESLEVGLSRTAMWGGDGRPQSLSVFKDLLIGEDNFSANQSGKSTEPGNQLGGIDLKFTHLHQQQIYACYTQFIGEDEAGGLPSGFLGLAGCSYQTSELSLLGLPSMQLSTVFMEFSNTTMGGWTGDANFGSAYEHSIYLDGYRHRNLTIGSQYNNDSKTLAIGWLVQQSPLRSYRLIFRNLDLNYANQNPLANSNNPVANSAQSTQQWDVAVTQSWQSYRGELSYVYNTDTASNTLLNAYSTWLVKLTWVLD